MLKSVLTADEHRSNWEKKSGARSGAPDLYNLGSFPRVKFVKAFTVDCANLTVGANYQLQVSSDMNTWTNWGDPFTATNAVFSNPAYQRVDDWSMRFLRLEAQ